MLLGDLIESALSKVGISSESIEKWVGMPCGCKERQEKLNQLHYWANRVAAGQVQGARNFLNRITGGH